MEILEGEQARSDDSSAKINFYSLPHIKNQKSHILAADARLTNSNPPILPLPPPIIETTDETNDTKDTIFIHWEYHPNDIPRRRIREIYNNTCGELLKEDLDICNTIVAYSRPPNLKDMITKAKLHQAPGKEASKYYSGELP